MKALSLRHATLGATCSRALYGRHLRNLIGKNDLRDAPVEDCALAGQVDELGVLAVGQCRLLPLRDLAEGGLKVHLLKGTRSKHLSFHLSSQGDDRRSIDVGIPQPGQQIGRTGAGDREAGRGPTSQFAVG